jgi:hypothetical protein
MIRNTSAFPTMILCFAAVACSDDQPIGSLLSSVDGGTDQLADTASGPVDLAPQNPLPDMSAATETGPGDDVGSQPQSRCPTDPPPAPTGYACGGIASPVQYQSSVCTFATDGGQLRCRCTDRGLNTWTWECQSAACPATSPMDADVCGGIASPVQNQGAVCAYPSAAGQVVCRCLDEGLNTWKWNCDP